MTQLTPEEIKQIEQEANEMFPPINSNHPAAMQNEFNNSQLRNVWIEVSTKYLLQLKEEREMAGKMREALEELVKWCTPDDRWNYMAALENAQKLINEYDNYK